MLNQNESRQQQIKRHHEKWKAWKISIKRKNQQNTQNSAILFKARPQQDASNYAKRLIERIQQSQNYKECPVIKKFADQLQTNTCPICFQLMVPPSIPIILFPCGHNICKICVYSKGSTNNANLKLKFSTCPICRKNIQNSTQNKNLMKLICNYLDKKELIQKSVEQQAKQQSQIDTITKLGQHCSLLQKEKKALVQQLTLLKNNKKIFQEVVERLLDERKKCRKQIQVYEEQQRLINKHIDQKQQEIQKYQTKIQNLEEKQKIVQRTLVPLKIEKQKQQFKLITKLVERK